MAVHKLHCGKPARQHGVDDPLARRQRRRLRRQEQSRAQGVAFAAGDLPGRSAEDVQAAGFRAQRAGQGMQQTGLAGAGRADQGDLFALGHVQVQLAQCQRIAGGARVVDADLVKLECHAMFRFFGAVSDYAMQGQRRSD